MNGKEEKDEKQEKQNKNKKKGDDNDIDMNGKDKNDEKQEKKDNISNGMNIFGFISVDIVYYLFICCIKR